MGAIGTGTAIALAGCGLRDDPETDPGAVETTAPAVDADSDLVTAVAAVIATAWATAAEAAKAVPAVRPAARSFAALHRAHLDRLGVDPDRTEAVALDPARAGTQLRGREEQLRDRLVRAAVQAESGALAQVFASMAAAIDQRLAVTA